MRDWKLQCRIEKGEWKSSSKYGWERAFLPEIRENGSYTSICISRSWPSLSNEGISCEKRGRGGGTIQDLLSPLTHADREKDSGFRFSPVLNRWGATWGSCFWNPAVSWRRARSVRRASRECGRFFTEKKKRGLRVRLDASHRQLFRITRQENRLCRTHQRSNAYLKSWSISESPWNKAFLIERKICSKR